MSTLNPKDEEELSRGSGLGAGWQPLKGMRKTRRLEREDDIVMGKVFHTDRVRPQVDS